MDVVVMIRSARRKNGRESREKEKMEKKERVFIYHVDGLTCKPEMVML